ncbi:MAG: hypothetical protein WA988_02435 [Candidatus Nanopelagicales bacterium]
MITTGRLVAMVTMLAATITISGCALVPGNNQGKSQQELEDTLNAQQLPPGTTQTNQSVKGTQYCPFTACGEQAFISVSRTYKSPLPPNAVIEYMAQRQPDPIPTTAWKTLTTFPDANSSCSANHASIAYGVTTRPGNTTELSMYVNGLSSVADLGVYAVPCKLLNR